MSQCTIFLTENTPVDLDNLNNEKPTFEVFQLDDRDDDDGNFAKYQSIFIRCSLKLFNLLNLNILSALVLPKLDGNYKEHPVLDYIIAAGKGLSILESNLAAFQETYNIVYQHMATVAKLYLDRNVPLCFVMPQFDDNANLLPEHVVIKRLIEELAQGNLIKLNIVP